ncbi:MAG: lipopolysaccharide biosynthesis protein [Janthinobacterium lividum]
MITQMKSIFLIFRLQPFEGTTEEGRSKERLRRAALTTVSAGAARAIGIAVSMVSVPLTVRYLGPERYGLWVVLLSIIAAMGIADLGIGNGLMNTISDAYGRDDRRMARECVTSAFVMMLGIAVVLALGGAAAYPFVPWMRVFNVKSAAIAVEGSHAFAVLFIWFLINIPLGVVYRAQAGLQKGYLPQLVGALGNVLTLLALLVIIKLHGNLAWLVFGSTIGGVVGIVMNATILFREHPWLIPARHAYSSTTAKTILRLGLMFFVLQCAVAIGYTSDNIVITQILGAAAVAAYAVPQKLFSAVSMVINMALSPLWPAYGEAIARGDVAWVRRIFFASFRTALLVSTALCTTLIFAGPWILRVAVGKTLNVPRSLLVAMAIWGVVESLSVAMAMLLNGAGVLKEQTVVAIVVSLTNLALSIVLTRRFGLLGVCVGSILTQLLLAFPPYLLLVRNLFRKLATKTAETHLVEIQAS